MSINNINLNTDELSKIYQSKDVAIRFIDNIGWLCLTDIGYVQIEKISDADLNFLHNETRSDYFPVGARNCITAIWKKRNKLPKLISPYQAPQKIKPVAYLFDNTLANVLSSNHDKDFHIINSSLQWINFPSSNCQIATYEGTTILSKGVPFETNTYEVVLKNSNKTVTVDNFNCILAYLFMLRKE